MMASYYSKLFTETYIFMNLPFTSKKFIYGLVVGFLLLLGVWLIRPPQLEPLLNTAPSVVTSNENGSNKNQLVMVIIDFGDSRALTSEVQAETVFAALAAAAQANNLTLQTRTYDFGTMVEEIGDSQNTPDKAWIYFVNGEPGQVAADQMQIKPGDQVEWKYIKPN